MDNNVKKKNTTRMTVVFVVMIVLVVGYYSYLVNKSKEEKASLNVTAIERVLGRDLSNNYPATPKEVIKYYNEILKCLYNEESTPEEVDSVAVQSRELFDEELLSVNELGTYLMNIEAEVKDYKSKSRRIASISLASSANVDYYSLDGFDFARIACTYIMAEGKANSASNMFYLLRKDENRKWKIYGWADASKVKTSADDNGE